MRPRSDPTITPDLLLRAYAAGLFPMAESADDPTLSWFDPKRRGIFPLDALIVSRSLRKTILAERFTIGLDCDFAAVIEACAEAGPDRQSTWINTTIRHLFAELFARGAAHTVEARRDGVLVGGLYGVSIGGAFFGESMFHRETDASKVCLVHLAAHLVKQGFTLLDAQFVTPHLETLGAVEITREAYHARLKGALRQSADFGRGAATGVSGREALEIVATARRQAPVDTS